jgi:hypothetical protein
LEVTARKYGISYEMLLILLPKILAATDPVNRLPLPSARLLLEPLPSISSTRSCRPWRRHI